MKKFFNKNCGFTIVESLVAITILTLVIAGAMSAVQTGIKSSIYSKDQTIAFFLAQEAFEQIRNLRDENGLNDRNWLSGISQVSTDPCYFGSSCRVDLGAVSSAPTRCASFGNCGYLRQNPTYGLYGYTASWTQSIFRRDIVLTSINSKEIVVTVTVTWTRGALTRTFKAQENLFNWQTANE